MNEQDGGGTSDQPPKPDLLLVGSGLEAHIAERHLAKLGDTVTVHHLPVAPTEFEFAFVRKGALPSEVAGPKMARITDVWGKAAVQFRLPELVLVEPQNLQTPHSLAAGLKLTRTSLVDDGVLATLSDGTELLCQGVIFADGPKSEGHKFWDKPAKPTTDPYAVKTWSFVGPNFQQLETWDFRWAAAKSVELIPLPKDRVWARLRFKSSYGTKLTVAELKDLFSEFGSDMTGLFENLSDDSISFSEEANLTHTVFCPAAGCVALGQAVWPSPPMLCFDWLSRFVEQQMQILTEQIRLDSWNSESFEAQSREVLQDLSQAERFARRHLHSDNVFLRPLRNLLLQVVPNSVLAPQLKKRLFL